MGECSAYSSLYRRTQRSSLQHGLRVGGYLALTDFGLMNHSELSHMAGAVHDNTINIVVVIIIMNISHVTTLFERYQQFLPPIFVKSFPPKLSLGCFMLLCHAFILFIYCIYIIYSY